jgi:hypothetical protein
LISFGVSLVATMSTKIPSIKVLIRLNPRPDEVDSRAEPYKTKPRFLSISELPTSEYLRPIVLKRIGARYAGIDMRSDEETISGIVWAVQKFCQGTVMWYPTDALDACLDEEKYWYPRDFDYYDEMAKCGACRRRFSIQDPELRPLVPLGFYDFVQRTIDRDSILHVKCCAVRANREMALNNVRNRIKFFVGCTLEDWIDCSICAARTGSDDPISVIRKSDKPGRIWKNCVLMGPKSMFKDLKNPDDLLADLAPVAT